MKRILSYLLIGIYATIMIKPVMPTVVDVFEHIFNYSEHMATVHQHNGKYHVHLEYIAEAKKNSHSDNPYNNLPKKTNSSSEHIMFTMVTNILLPASPQDYLHLHSQNLPAISPQDNLRPPIAFAV